VSNEAITSSKGSTDFVSRSRIKNFGERPSSSSVAVMNVSRGVWTDGLGDSRLSCNTANDSSCAVKI
jgi:hypothetical protein